MQASKPGGVVGEALRMNEQKQIRKRSKRLGPEVREDNSIQARFTTFHSENPDIYDALVRLARRIKKSGTETYGIVGLYEVVRYDRFISSNGMPFKLNNDFRSRYARLIMEREEDLSGFFKTRELQTL